jgi:hypothetical protein
MNSGIQNLVAAPELKENYFILNGVKYENRRTVNRTSDNIKVFGQSENLGMVVYQQQFYNKNKIVVEDNDFFKYWTNQRKQKQHILR